MRIKSLAALSCLALTLATIPQGWSSFVWGQDGSWTRREPGARTLDPDVIDTNERCADLKMLLVDMDWIEGSDAEGRFIVITAEGELILLRCRG